MKRLIEKKSMLAMVLEKPGSPLELKHVDIPAIKTHEVLIEVLACGICRTDIHILDGELANPRLPLIPGHQIVGKIIAMGEDVRDFKIGDRVGASWLAGSCGGCSYCLSDRENLCDYASFNGYDVNGGFAEYCSQDFRYIFRLPDRYSDAASAPLLCAGLIGYRALQMTADAKNLGFYGFGASAHLLTQLCIHQKKNVFAFTKQNDFDTQAFAKKMGAAWAGNSEDLPPCKLDAAIIFAPAGDLVPKALSAVAKGGIVVCAGIHMSDLPSFPYSLLWNERCLKSVANLTRKDGREFLEIISRLPIDPQTTTFQLKDANEAIQALRNGEIQGTAVLLIRSQSWV